MNLARVRKLTVRELRCRGVQHAHKLVDRLVPSLGTGRIGHSWRSSRSSDEAAALSRFLDSAPHRFFRGGGASTAAASARFPELRRDILDAAADIRRGRFDLLGYRGLHFGDPVDWQYEPVGNRRAPCVHWSRLNPLDASIVGDSKVVWELNRHQWMVGLGQAFQLTGDSSYAETAFAHIDDWLEQNPYGIGINWTSSLEVALRLIAWSWTIMLLRRSPALTPDRFLRIQSAIHAHASHIERYLSLYFSPNTHLTGEALGLLYAGVLFAAGPHAARWRDLGRQILLAELERQVGPDGAYFELATCYHRYTIEIYLHLLLLAEQNRIALPDRVSSTVQRMTEWLLGMSHPDRTMPPVGDADGGWLLPLVRRGPDDCRGVFAVAAVVFKRPDFAWAAGGPAPELMWLLGPDSLSAFDRVGSQPPAFAPSRVFPSGYAVMRDGWRPDAHQLIVDVGPLGCPVSGAHGHADLLSLQCAAFGESYLVDPGTYCYTQDPAWRDHFRGTTAHTTVVIDGQNQAEMGGPFAWRARPVSRVRGWESTETHDFIDAEHDGYARLKSPVRHRRRVLFVKPEGWVVIDDVYGKGAHRIDLRFQFSPRVVLRGPDLWISASGRRGKGLWLTPVAGHDVKVDIRQGELEPMDGWMSPGYGVRVPAPVVVYHAIADLPRRFITIIVPTESLSAVPPALDLVATPDPSAVAFRFPHSNRIVHVAADTLALEEGARRRRIA